MIGGARKFSGFYFINALIPLMRALSLCPNHLLKAPPPKTIILGIRVQHMNGGGKGGTNVQFIAEVTIFKVVLI